MERLIVAGALLGSSLCLAGCMTTQGTPANCGAQPTEAEIAASVHAYIEGSNWKDPESVHVRNVRMQGCRAVWKGLINGGGYSSGWEIDFEVNAKNSYGGYTGFQLRSILRTPDGRIQWNDTD